MRDSVVHGIDLVDPLDLHQLVMDRLSPRAANQLLRRGLRKTDFPVGLEIVVEGYAAKSGAPKASGQNITMADGRNFFLGVDNTGGGAR